jgi:oxygen-dependent protoporphyrinogen oxidase
MSLTQFSSHVILGGGISGLATTYYLSRKFPNARLLLIESDHRVGGWVHSEDHPVEGTSLLCEYGPRSIRPSGEEGGNTLQLVST